MIDTSVVITLERRGLGIRDIPNLAPAEPIELASITVSELLVGIERAADSARRRRRHAFIEHLLATIPVFPFDVGAARIHARIWATLASEGQMIGQHDLIIAATAIANDYHVLTENQREFARIPSVIVRLST